MRSLGQFQACLLFFLGKNFERTKTCHKQKPTNKILKGESRLFCILVLFYAQNLFIKEINRLEIVLVTSFTILLGNICGFLDYLQC